MPFQHIDPYIKAAADYANAAAKKDAPTEERAIMASLSQTWALIAVAQAQTNTWIQQSLK